MIVFGKRAKVLGTEQLPTACTFCGQNKQFLSVYQSYLHIFWIPTVPLPKAFLIQCMHCQKVTKDKELPPVEKERFRAKKSQFKTPLWFFTGLLLIGSLFAYFAYEEKMEKSRSESFRQAPQVGDLYVVRLKDPHNPKLPVRVLKLLEVQGENLRFQTSNYGYRYASDVKSNLDRDIGKHTDFFSEESILLPRNNPEDGKMSIEHVIRK